MSKKQEADTLGYFLNPKFVVLSKKEKEELLKKYGISEQHIPKMFASDPVATQLKLKPGDVVKITRNDGTGEYVYYRIVVEG